MAINLDGIQLHDAVISIISNERRSLWVYTTNQKCINDLNDLPISIKEVSKGVYVMYPPMDLLAIAERIAISWENEGLKIDRQTIFLSKKTSIQSFVLA